MREITRMSGCAECGSFGPPGEYHPHAFCVLVKAIGSTPARMAINAVLDYGRKLERLGLPNTATIGETHRIEDARQREHERAQTAVKRKKPKRT